MQEGVHVPFRRSRWGGNQLLGAQNLARRWRPALSHQFNK